MFTTITIAVCYYRARYLLDNIIREWLIYSTGISIN